MGVFSAPGQRERPEADQYRDRASHDPSLGVGRSLAIPPRATVTVVTRSHECFYEPLLADAPPESVLVQPTNRGTAPAILYGLLKVAESNPAATIAIFPSDHYVNDDAAFMRHVELAVKAVEVCPKKTVLLGAWPTTPEVSYGWIEGGERLRVLPPSLPIFQVQRFWEKPSPGHSGSRV